jgi:hypothetical protein
MEPQSPTPKKGLTAMPSLTKAKLNFKHFRSDAVAKMTEILTNVCIKFH